MSAPVWNDEKSEQRFTPPWFLLSDSKAIDFLELVWRLDNSTTENPSLWWAEKPCAICGKRSVMYQTEAGYRCEEHRSILDAISPAVAVAKPVVEGS